MHTKLRHMTRRRLLTAGLAGTCAAIGSTVDVEAAEPTAEERANVTVVRDSARRGMPTISRD